LPLILLPAASRPRQTQPGHLSCLVRTRGGSDLRVGDVVIPYDRAPAYAVSVMEVTADLVTHETQ
jgi:hypothetical protein